MTHAITRTSRPCRKTWTSDQPWPWDIFTIHEDKTNRLIWRIGTVEELLKTKDGKVRAALVRIINNSGQPIVMKRPLQKQFPIEFRSERGKSGDFPITFVEQAKQEN